VKCRGQCKRVTENQTLKNRLHLHVDDSSTEEPRIQVTHRGEPLQDNRHHSMLFISNFLKRSTHSWKSRRSS